MAYLNSTDLRGGAIWLDDCQARALRMLDDTFRSWGTAAGASEMVAPPLLPVEDLTALDCYRNFPHLAFVTGNLDIDDVDDLNRSADVGKIERDRVSDPELGLPTAACWGVYVAHKRCSVPADSLVTLVGRCFRAEDHYDGLRRMLGFHMREVVALGTPEHCAEHLSRFSDAIQKFAAELGLDMRVESATDPFYDNSGSRGLLAQLAPVKHEFLVGDLAIASVNTHRSFFGERCQISLEDSPTPVSTSCVAFGLERWVAALEEAHGKDWNRIAQLLENADKGLRTGVAA